MNVSCLNLIIYNDHIFQEPPGIYFMDWSLFVFFFAVIRQCGGFVFSDMIGFL